MASHLVAQNAITTFTSPVAGTIPIDANTVRGNDNTIKTAYNLHDADATIHFQDSTLASRPAAGTAGRKWFTQDGLRLYYDNGVTWDEAAYALSASGAFTGPVTITSTTANQLTILYDTSNKVTIDVSSAGAVTFNATGASAGFAFSDAVTLSSTLTVVGPLAVTANYARVASFGGGTTQAVIAGSPASDYGAVGYNAVPTNSTGVWNYGATDVASLIQFYNGGFKLKTAASGTAGNPITFTDVLAITQAGAVTFAGAVSGVTTIAASGTVTLTATGTAIASSGAITIATGKKLGLNASATTAIWESSANVIDFYISGSRVAVLSASSAGFLTNTSYSGLLTLLAGSTPVAGSAGDVVLSSTTQSTIGANGGASALTANPLGYLKGYLGTTAIIIPYYNA